MEGAILKIIDGLLCTDTDRIQQATAELKKAYDNPETVLCLTKIAISHEELQMRQFAAVLLNSRLKKLRHWQMVSAEHQAAIKSSILQVLVTEKEKKVKNSVAQLMGTLVRHEAEKGDSWMGELLKFIYERSSSPNPEESELGSSIFSKLTDAAPDQFALHMESIFQLFTTVLSTAEASGNLATQTVLNMLIGTCYLLPFVSGHSAAEQTVVKAVPLIIKALHAFALKGDVHEFMCAFDIVDSMAEYVPHLLTSNVKQLLEFTLVTASNNQLEDSIRVQAITFVGCLARIKKKVIMKQKLLEPTLTVIFQVMCQDTSEGDDYFTGESPNSPSCAATQTLDLMAIHMSPEKFIPPLLQLLEPALQNPDPICRRSSFICMGVIAEGCSEAITHKYLEVMLNIIKAGIADSTMSVRVAAFFALGQFAEFLQPDICKFASQILPVLFDYLNQLVVELKAGQNSNGSDPASVSAKDTIMYLDKLQIKRKSVLTKYRMGQPEPKHMERMFYALETFCEHLDDDIVQHLPVLMNCLFEVLDSQNSIHIRELALSSIASASSSAKMHMMPFFPRIMTILQAYLVKDCPEEMNNLRIQAIDTLAALISEVGKENSLPLADDTMNYCLMMLEDGPDDPDFRRSIYNLMGSLSSVVNESMANVFPNIMDRILESVISSEDVLPKVPEDVEKDLILEAANVEIDLEHTDDEDDSEDLDGFQVENDYVDEKEEAILALKDFADHTGVAFAPYIQSAFENVYKVIDHPQEDIRKACVVAICGFIIALNKMGNKEGVTRACEIAIPKFAHIIRTDEDMNVVIRLLEELAYLFNDVKLAAITNQENADLIFGCIKDVFANKMGCQFNEQSGGGDEDDQEESQCDVSLIENAANLLPMFGHTLKPEIFSLYFGRIYQFLVQKLAKAKKQDEAEHRAYIYGSLADCFQCLRKCSVTYFDALCPLFITGTKDSDPKSRQNSFYGLGELVFFAEEKSFQSYPAILQALSEAIARESNASAMDNICGAVARLIVTNHEAVPLGHVLPVFLNHLPLKEDVVENKMIQKAFHVLYLHARPSIDAYIEQMLIITIEASYKKQMPDDETTESAVAFIKEIREHYPDKFNTVSNSNPEVFNYVHTL